jgi:amino acid transporter
MYVIQSRQLTAVAIRALAPHLLFSARSTPLASESGDLERALGLKEAVALNMIEMVGIGPFVVIPLVIKAMGGPQCLLAWAAGAVLALLDGFVWSELGAAMPLAGGSYVFLREAYGPGRMGRLMSFLFVWQTLIQAPLSLASGAIGFSQYASLALLAPFCGSFGVVPRISNRISFSPTRQDLGICPGCFSLPSARRPSTRFTRIGAITIFAISAAKSAIRHATSRAAFSFPSSALRFCI